MSKVRELGTTQAAPFKNELTEELRRDSKLADSLPNIREALFAGYKVELIIGPKFEYDDDREELANLLQQYGREKLVIYSAPVKPERTGCSINGNLLYIDQDGEGATAVEGADSVNLGLFEKHFYNNATGGELKDTPEKIRQMPVVGG